MPFDPGVYACGFGPRFLPDVKAGKHNARHVGNGGGNYFSNQALLQRRSLTRCSQCSYCRSSALHAQARANRSPKVNRTHDAKTMVTCTKKKSIYDLIVVPAAKCDRGRIASRNRVSPVTRYSTALKSSAMNRQDIVLNKLKKEKVRSQCEIHSHALIQKTRSAFDMVA